MRRAWPTGWPSWFPTWVMPSVRFAPASTSSDSDEEDPGVRAGVLTLVRSLSPVLGFNVRVSFDGPIDSVISQSVTEQLLATIREAVTNIGRHARATEASVSRSAPTTASARLRVVDKRHGTDTVRPGATTPGLGRVRPCAGGERKGCTGPWKSPSQPSGGTVLAVGGAGEPVTLLGWLAHDGHRARGMTCALVGNRPEHDVAMASVPARSDDQKFSTIA